MFENILEIASTTVKLMTTITGSITIMTGLAKTVKNKLDKNTVIVKYFGKTHRLKLRIDKYETNDNLRIGLTDRKGNVFSYITTNACSLTDETWACVDTDCCPFAEKLIEDYSLGKPVGISIPAGTREYPVYKFDLDKIKEYA